MCGGCHSLLLSSSLQPQCFTHQTCHPLALQQMNLDFPSFTYNLTVTPALTPVISHSPHIPVHFLCLLSFILFAIVLVACWVLHFHYLDLYQTACLLLVCLSVCVPTYTCLKHLSVSSFWSNKVLNYTSLAVWSAFGPNPHCPHQTHPDRSVYLWIYI